jgi:hypothetical protein
MHIYILYILVRVLFELRAAIRVLYFSAYSGSDFYDYSWPLLYYVELHAEFTYILYIYKCKTIRGVKFYFELNDYYLKLARRITYCALFIVQTTINYQKHLKGMCNVEHGFGLDIL